MRVAQSWLTDIIQRTNPEWSVTPEELAAGSVEWDLLTEDRLAVSYGVYLYHVEAPGVGETTGTFALLK